MPAGSRTYYCEHLRAKAPKGFLHTHPFGGAGRRPAVHLPYRRRLACPAPRKPRASDAIFSLVSDCCLQYPARSTAMPTRQPHTSFLVELKALRAWENPQTRRGYSWPRSACILAISLYFPELLYHGVRGISCTRKNIIEFVGKSGGL